MPKTPSKAKSSKASSAASTGPVSAKMAVTAATVVYGLWAVGGVFFPEEFAKAYMLPLAALKESESAISYATVVLSFQSWFTWILGTFGLLSIVRRVGSKSTQGISCLCFGLCFAYMLIYSELKLNTLTAAIGIGEMAVNANRAIFGLMSVLSFLGWLSAGKPMPDLKHLIDINSDRASKYLILLCTLYGIGFHVCLDKILALYKFNIEGAAAKWITFEFSYLGAALVVMALQLTFLLSADSRTKTQVNRFLWCFFSILTVSHCYLSTMYVNVLTPGIDKNGQLVNIGLWLTGAVLAWWQMTS